MDRDRIAEISERLDEAEDSRLRDVAKELLDEVKRLTDYEEPVKVIGEENAGYRYAWAIVQSKCEELTGECPVSYITAGRLLAQEGITSFTVEADRGMDQSFYAGVSQLNKEVNSCARNWSILMNRKK